MGKKVAKIPKYLKELFSLDNEIRNDQKLLKKIFGEKPAYFNFMLDNV